jgi:hypothetical protein
MKKAQSIKRKLATAMLVASSVLIASIAPATASPQGYIQGQEGVGYFYGTFNESPNIALLVGGDAGEFCGAEDPGSAPSRVFLRSDGSVDIKVNDKAQPIFLYEINFGEVPPWLDQVCGDLAAGLPTPEPFATGTADLKIRVSVVSDDFVEVFNSVNGKATGTDGTQYKVHAAADLVVGPNGPLGNPEDFVSFSLKEIGS